MTYNEEEYEEKCDIEGKKEEAKISMSYYLNIRTGVLKK